MSTVIVERLISVYDTTTLTTIVCTPCHTSTAGIICWGLFSWALCISLVKHLRILLRGMIQMIVSGLSTPCTAGRRLRPKFWMWPIPSSANSWGTIHLILGYGPTTLGWRRGPTNLKRTNPTNDPCLHFSTIWWVRAGGISPPVYPSRLPPQPGARPGPPKKHTPGLPAADKLYQPRGLGKATALGAWHDGTWPQKPTRTWQHVLECRIHPITTWRSSCTRGTCLIAMMALT
jgi:hypothetical protein